MDFPPVHTSFPDFLEFVSLRGTREYVLYDVIYMTFWNRHNLTGVTGSRSVSMGAGMMGASEDSGLTGVGLQRTFWSNGNVLYFDRSMYGLHRQILRTCVFYCI